MTVDWRALQRAIDGDVVLPGSPEYESARKPPMARFEQVRPAAVRPSGSPASRSAVGWGSWAGSTA